MIASPVCGDDAMALHRYTTMTRQAVRVLARPAAVSAFLGAEHAARHSAAAML
jgi:hypothetical protein